MRRNQTKCSSIWLVCWWMRRILAMHASNSGFARRHSLGIVWIRSVCCGPTTETHNGQKSERFFTKFQITNCVHRCSSPWILSECRQLQPTLIHLSQAAPLMWASSWLSLHWWRLIRLGNLAGNLAVRRPIPNRHQSHAATDERCLWIRYRRPFRLLSPVLVYFPFLRTIQFLAALDNQDI